MLKVCPKCGKDYSHDQFWTTSLKRHLQKKKSCEKKNENISQITPFDEIIIHEKEIPLDIPMESIGIWLFNKIENKNCFVKPNMRMDEIWIKESKKQKTKIITIKEFITLFINKILLKQLPRTPSIQYDPFNCWIHAESFINFDHQTWDGDCEYDNPFMKPLMEHILNVMNRKTNKRLLKNILNKL